MLVVRVEERLDRPVRGLRLMNERERRERRALLEQCTRPCRQVRHLRVRPGAARSPLPYLLDAVRGLVREHLCDEVEIHGRTVARGRTLNSGTWFVEPGSWVLGSSHGFPDAGAVARRGVAADAPLREGEATRRLA